MPTPLKSGVSVLQERIQNICKRTVVAIEADQKKHKGMLSPEARRQLKTLSDIIADQVKLQRGLDEDLNRFLESLPEHIVKAIADYRKNPAGSARKAPGSQRTTVDGGSDAGEELGGEVGSEAEARGPGSD
jgi:hypothetical protein